MIKEIIKNGEAEFTYRMKEILSKNPKLEMLFWETTLRCNAKCKHCGSRAGENIKIEDELSTEEIKKAFKSIADVYDARKIFLEITGGEPLIRQDLFEVLEYTHSLGYEYGMTSNGMLINDDIIEKMKKTGMKSISISIDGLEKSHDEFRGVKGSYKKIVENIKKLKKANFLRFLQVTTVVNNLNINELEELYEEIKKLGVDSWRIINIEPIGRTFDNKNLLLDEKGYRYLINFIKEKRKKSKFEITYGCSHFLGMKNEKEVRNHMFFCIAGYTVGSILYNGDIYVCPSVERRKDLIQGNIKKDNFVEVWEKKFKWFRDLDKLKCNECEQCSEWKYCRGDSLHTWDFENSKPRICLKNFLEIGDDKNE